ncbi:MAG: isoprenylcysteine carboxylmethyltransferase family protein [Verrucomicrobiales bacterium]|nr:isoprenylcysteine carboxylmethyltransferase family protein [Verrucomicrobiales bacterium]
MLKCYTRASLPHAIPFNAIWLAILAQWELIGEVLFLRALLSFLVLPGTFGGLIPAWIVSTDPNRGRGSYVGILPLTIGVAIVLWCVRDFYVAGKGTLAPWDPPKNLVVVGPYRFTRNPMYVGVSLWLVGWSLLAASPWLAGYTAILVIGFHLRVLLYEEPRLRKQFGDEWVRYAATVPRWWPNRPRRK